MQTCHFVFVKKKVDCHHCNWMDEALFLLCRVAACRVHLRTPPASGVARTIQHLTAAPAGTPPETASANSPAACSPSALLACGFVFDINPPCQSCFPSQTACLMHCNVRCVVQQGMAAEGDARVWMPTNVLLVLVDGGRSAEWLSPA